MSLSSDGVRRPWSRWRDASWRPAGLLIFVQLTSGMRDMPQFAFFLLYLQEQLGLLPVTISGVVAGAQIAGAVTALLGGAIAARLGSKWVLVCGLLLAGVSSLVFQTQSFWWVTLLWFVGGAGAALISIGGASYLTRLSARGTLGLLAAFYALSMTIGGAIGNPIAGVMIERSGFGAFGWAAMGLSLAAILVVAFGMAPLQDRVTAPVSFRSLGANLLRPMGRTEVVLLIGLRALPTFFYGMVSLLIPLLINALTGDKVIVAAFGTTMLIVASFAQLLAGRSADRWGARAPTLAAYAIILVSGVGLAASTGRVWGLYAFGVLGISAAWALSTLMYVWVVDGIPKADHPATFGLLHAVWSFSMIGGSLVGGWLVSSTPWLPFLLAGLLNAGSFFLIVAYYRRIAAGKAAL